MKVLSRTITVRWTQPGFHCWPEAEGERDYLSDRHRHLFLFDLSMPVGHNDREVEFHDLLDHARQWAEDCSYNGVAQLGRLSCEDIALQVGEHVAERWPRPMTIAVFEDGECGATVHMIPDPT